MYAGAGSNPYGVYNVNAAYSAPSGGGQPQQGGGNNGGWMPSTFDQQGNEYSSAPSTAQPHHHAHTSSMNAYSGSFQTPGVDDDEDYSMEPPLMEELGINFDHIWRKTQSVINPIKPLEDHLMDDADLAGPLFFCLAFGVFLLLTGKVHFGYIYGFGVSGCLALYVVLNLLSLQEIDMWRVCSILGYCLLPVIGLAFLGIVISLKSTMGHVLGVGAILWSTYASTRLFEKAMNMSQQRWLVAYPVGLLYSVFTLITIF